MRQTSVDSYNLIKEQGLLSRLQFDVYHVIFTNGPITQGETWSEYFYKSQRHAIAPRFAELERRGVIEVVGERVCRLSGRNCTIWDVTGKIPVKYEKPKRYKCARCNGKGYVEERQAKLF